MKLVAGLRNPGSRYAATRHNAGAWYINALAEKYSLQFKLEKKFHLELAETQIKQQRVLVVKPTTYMNESGLALAAIVRFYQIEPENLFIAHDELDFASGIIRLKAGGGHGGHNGLKDIFAHLGKTDFYRLRIGIGHPGDRNRVVDYVLSSPTSAEKMAIDAAIARAISLFPEMISNAQGLSRAIQTLNTDQ